MKLHVNAPKRVQIREQNKRTMFDNGTGMTDAIETSILSLKTHASEYPHWIITYSGGKDSSATLSFVLYCIQQGLIDAPESLTVLYADTGMELSPLHITAMETLRQVEELGYIASHVLPRYTERFFVNLLGRGLPPPRLKGRWCTRTMKKQPMDRAAAKIKAHHGEDSVLFVTGVRMGESQARDERISTSCSTSDGECGQGWFQQNRHALAPIMHWRTCWVWNWIYADENPLPVIRGIDPAYDADRYGGVDIRTGCVGCVIVQEDLALKYLVRKPGFEHLAPLMRLKPLYDEMRNPQWRHRSSMYTKKDGTFSAAKSFKLGPLTIPARKHFLAEIKKIQDESGFQLISPREEILIKRMWKWGFFPTGWDGTEAIGTEPYDKPLFSKKIKRNGKTVAHGKFVGTQLSLLD